MSKQPGKPLGAASNRSLILIALLVVSASATVHAQSGPAIRRAESGQASGMADPRAVEIGRYRLQRPRL